jgi:methylenetetrahydrofolate dehydrogenase (NADP+)/methenyltetrahydrofolate cyclohydrolase
MVQRIDGRKIGAEIEEEIKAAVSRLKGRAPGLAFVSVGNNPASLAYIRMKKKGCAKVGFRSFDKELPATITQADLLKEISSLNRDREIDGILVQLPLPDHISPLTIMEAIDPNKDVDGFHPVNMGKLLLGETSGFFPCTPQGIVTLLIRSRIETSGKHIVIVGRSNIVGKPLAAMLMQKAPGCNGTVTIAHSRTSNLAEICRSADILIAAAGSPGLIRADMVREDAVVIDVGINRVDGSIIGDVDFEAVAPRCRAITPVPGGVGPMTIAMLLSNTLKAYRSFSTQ